MTMTLAEVNALSRVDFAARFGDVAEQSPWVAERAAAARPYSTRERMIQAFESAITAARPEQQLALLRAHPDLAASAALRSALSEESRREQSGAGLDALTAEEMDHFTGLNRRYHERFGFPFILAVRGATRHQILASFEERFSHGPEEEFAQALLQVCRIIRFRIEDRVSA